MLTLKSSRRVHRKYGKLFFLCLVVSKGTILDTSPQNQRIFTPVHGFRNLFSPRPILTYISQTKHLVNVPVGLVHSDILYLLPSSACYPCITKCCPGIQWGIATAIQTSYVYTSYGMSPIHFVIFWL